MVVEAGLRRTCSKSLVVDEALLDLKISLHFDWLLMNWVDGVLPRCFVVRVIVVRYRSCANPAIVKLLWHELLGILFWWIVARPKFNVRFGCQRRS